MSETNVPDFRIPYFFRPNGESFVVIACHSSLPARANVFNLDGIPIRFTASAISFASFRLAIDNDAEAKKMFRSTFNMNEWPELIYYRLELRA